ncbi:tyrosine-protein phosphatase [Microbacterium halotolerans]|uniref:tyrosine-protein phosphatase n=1 Tax=Microbacterium halotolerans TaxID=246613 RepID=UPI000E6AA772|nr:tyrosine-protein phosphatase [Microbacterium halotolerans]
MTATGTAPWPGVDGAINFRDVGGLPASGGITRRGVLFRSGALSELTPEGQRRLRELGIRRIIDLRSDEELATEPSRSGGIETFHLPLFLGSVGSFFRPDMTLGLMYRSLLDQAGERLARAARLIAQDDPAVVHCTAGKDRTGVTTALVLSAVGVPDEAVVADYARTESLLPETRNRAMLTGLRASGLDRENLIDLAMRSPAHVMAGFLTELRQRHGSAQEWFREQGMSAAELHGLRDALVDGG